MLDSSALVGTCTLIKHGATVNMKNQVNLCMIANEYYIVFFTFKDFVIFREVKLLCFF